MPIAPAAPVHSVNLSIHQGPAQSPPLCANLSKQQCRESGLPAVFALLGRNPGSYLCSKRSILCGVHLSSARTLTFVVSMPRRNALRNKLMFASGTDEIQFMEHEPGPRGSPQAPQGRALIAGAFSAETAKRESCWSSFLLSHLGHCGFCLPITMVSK